MSVFGSNASSRSSLLSQSLNDEQRRKLDQQFDVADANGDGTGKQRHASLVPVLHRALRAAVMVVFGVNTVSRRQRGPRILHQIWIVDGGAAQDLVDGRQGGQGLPHPRGVL
jgi:hypothetical protein